MYELKKIGKLFTSKYVGNGPSSYEKRIYWTAVLRRLRNTTVEPVYNFKQCSLDCSCLPAYSGCRNGSLTESVRDACTPGLCDFVLI